MHCKYSILVTHLLPCNKYLSTKYNALDFNKIKQQTTEKQMTMTALADQIGMSRGGLSTAINNKTLTIEALEKIAEVLDVPVTVFFDEQSANWNNKELIAEIVTLEIKNQDLEEKINTLKDTIRSKRSFLKLVYNHLKSLQDNRLYETIMAIDEAENFEETDQILKDRQAERNKRNLEGKSKYELQKVLNEKMNKRSETDITAKKEEKDINDKE